jgi:hypothetical protein
MTIPQRLLLNFPDTIRSCAGFQIEPAQSDGTVRSPDLNSLREPNTKEPEKILHELIYADGLGDEVGRTAAIDVRWRPRPRPMGFHPSSQMLQTGRSPIC